MGINRGERRDLTLICVGGGVTWFGNALALISLMLVLRPAGGFALTPTGPTLASRSWPD
ncbi:MAG TPA: hypothetical protein VGJ45_07545 [Pseudonocardiaceae bacterium]|jgi:hypothetical protein